MLRRENDRLFREYFLKLKGKAILLTKNKQDAEDILQNLAIKLIRFKVLELPYHEQMLIASKALVNTYKDWLRKKKRRVNPSYYINGDFFGARGVQAEAPLTIEYKEALEFLKGIPEKQRLAVLAMAFGFTGNEIMQALGDKTKNTTLAHIRHGRHKLKTKWV